MSSAQLKVLLLKPEVTPGVDPTPTGAANAVLIRDDVTVPQFDVRYADRNNARGHFGRDQQLVAGKALTIGFSVEAAGSGTAGTAPAYANALKTSGMGEKILAAAVTGTMQAGSASGGTLHAGASATDDLYKGYRIRTTAGTGSGQTRLISSYTGASKVFAVSEAWTTPPDATTEFSIDAQVAYYPISSSLTTATIYFYFLGMVHKLLYARGTATWMFPAGQIPYIQFEYTGVYGGISDASFPAVTLSGYQEPLPVNYANTSALRIHGTTGLKLYSFELALNNAIAYRNIPGAEDVLMTDRNPEGSVEFEAPNVATFDYATKVIAATLGVLSVTHGTSAGNRCHMDTLFSQLTSPQYGEQDGEGTLRLTTLHKPSSAGNDEFYYGVA